MSFGSSSLGIDKIILTDPLQKEKESKWYFGQELIKTNTPSRKRGMSYDEEMKLRRRGIRFMTQLTRFVYANPSASKNNNRQTSTTSSSTNNNNDPSHSRVFSTASVWFHRFYMVHPFQIFCCLEIAIACFYLAAKAEDQPESITTIVSTARNLRRSWLMPTQRSIDESESEEELKDLEDCIMKTLGFVVWVRHPHPYIHWLIHQFIIGDAEKLMRIQQLADRFATDSFSTPFCVRENPKKLAIAFISWACRHEKYQLNNWKNKSESMSNWLQVFNLKQEDVDNLYKEFCEHMLLNAAENDELNRDISSNNNNSGGGGGRFNKHVSEELRLQTDSQGLQLLNGAQFTDVSKYGSPIQLDD